MQLDVQWFIYALVQNQIVSAEQAVELNDEFGGDPTLEEYAEEIQRQLSAEFDVAGAATMAKQIRMVVRYAISQASTGTSPEIFEEIEEVIEPETPVQPLPLPITPPPMAPRPLSQVPAQEVVEIVEEEEVYEEIIEEVVEEDAVTGDDSDEIAYEITHKLRHGVTKLDGYGAYTGAPKAVLICVVNPNQITDFKRIIEKYDNTFSFHELANDTYGNFKRIRR